MLASMAFFPIPADAEAEGEEKSGPRVDVIGRVDRLPDIAGTATILAPQDLERAHVFTTTEALRKAPGVNVRDEEGFGLRPNIGIRGLNPTRSTKVLLLEDGIPLSYAPYGDNASYYHPPIDRFERIEILKGSEQLRFGPQTAGGVVNYITPVPKDGTTAKIKVTGGNRDYFNAHVQLGRGPVLLDYVHKQGEGSRDNTHARIDDLNIKAVFDVADNQSLTLRANAYIERSEVGYTGITQAEYRNFGQRYNPFDNDAFDANRFGGSATYQVQFSPSALLVTNLYASYFSRDWWRQSSRTTDTLCGTAFRDARLAGQRVDPDTCNANQGRLREYVSYGVEPRLFVQHKSFGLDNELELALRAHYETQDRRQENGAAPNARSGTLVENNERRVSAYSALIQNRFIAGPLTITPALRIENIHLERRNKLPASGTVSGSDSMTQLLPGIGATARLSEGSTVFAGVHRGFSPPRVEDLISNAGTTAVDVPYDDATEWELGIRGNLRPGIQFQAALFRNDFKQQVVVGSVAGGDLPLALGQALYQGVEASGRVDFGRLFSTRGNAYVRAAYQWLPTARIESPFVPLAASATLVNEEGNRLPYAPRHLLTFGFGYADPRGFTGEIELVHTSSQYSDFANTQSPTANGLAGAIDAYTVVNLSLDYQMPGTRWTLFGTIKNLFDTDYIADRTRGILPGTPRLVQAGVQYRF